MMVCQLSVEKAMAKSAADTNEKMEAKHRVTALQKAMVRVFGSGLYSYKRALDIRHE